MEVTLEDGGVDEKDGGEREDGAGDAAGGGWCGEVADGPQDGEQQDSCGVKALVHGEDTNGEHGGEAEQGLIASDEAGGGLEGEGKQKQDASDGGSEVGGQSGAAGEDVERELQVDTIKADEVVSEEAGGAVGEGVLDIGA